MLRALMPGPVHLMKQSPRPSCSWSVTEIPTSNMSWDQRVGCCLSMFGFDTLHACLFVIVSTLTHSCLLTTTTANPATACCLGTVQRDTIGVCVILKSSWHVPNKNAPDRLRHNLCLALHTARYSLHSAEIAHPWLRYAYVCYNVTG